MVRRKQIKFAHIGAALLLGIIAAVAVIYWADLLSSFFLDLANWLGEFNLAYNKTSMEYVVELMLALIFTIILAASGKRVVRMFTS